MTDQLETFDLKMLEDMIDATSSQELGCGITRSTSQDGAMHQSGQEAAPASRFHLPDDKKVKEMIATYGPNGSGSSASAALQKSLENKLRQQLPTGGLTMFIKGWNRKVTPLGRLYCQLAVSARPIGETDCGLWPTATANDATGSKYQYGKNREIILKLGGMAEKVAMWSTPSTRDHKDTPGMAKTSIDKVGLTMIAQGTGKMESGSTALTESKGSLNPEFPCWLMGIPNEWVSSIVRGMQSCRKSPPNLSAQPCLEDMLT